jgi:hypothetical protein
MANFRNLPVKTLSSSFCAQFVQTVNADLNRLGVVVSDTINVFGAAHIVHNLLLNHARNGKRIAPLSGSLHPIS